MESDDSLKHDASMPSLNASTPFSTFVEEIVDMSSPLRDAITNAYRRNEVTAIRDLLAQIKTDPALQTATQALAQQLVATVRAKRSRSSGVDALMHEFSLSSEEGIALMLSLIHI
mgnify:CR=1 FL=1